MTKLEVASGKAVKSALTWYETINDWFKSFGIVTGGLAASLADWVFGTVTMSVLLSNYSGWENVYIRLAVGAIFSLALWGIQIILWQLILTGQIAKVSNNKTYTFWIYVGVFLIVVAMKFGDDISDLFGVYWMVRDNPMKVVLPSTWYNTLLYTVLFLAWVVCGFSEVIMALSINLLKSDRGEQNKPNQPQQPWKSGHNHGQQFKPQQGQKPTPSSSNVRPIYQEPTYHPKPMAPSEQSAQTKKHINQNRREYLELLKKLDKPLSSDTEPKFKSPFHQDEEGDE